MAKTAKTETEAPVHPLAARKPVQLDLTQSQWDRCHKDLQRKLTMAITHGPETGDVGQISQIVADLRALDLVEATRQPATPPSLKVLTPEEQRIAADRAEQQAAASDPVLMQIYNQKVAQRESIEAARAGD